jgi:hypothetical protein
MTINSSTDIANLAADLLNTATVTNIDIPTTADEQLYNRWYNQSRRKVLREHPWNCATKRATLAASSTAPAFGYAKQFPVPSDFIRLKYICDSDGNIIQNARYDFEAGSILYSEDQASLNIVYVYDLVDVSRMDPLMVDLIAYELALSVAYKVTGANTSVERIGTLQRARGSLAKSIDGQESPPKRIEYSKSLSARRNLGYRRTDVFADG